MAARLVAVGVALAAAFPATAAAAAPVKYLEDTAISLPAALSNAQIGSVAALPGGGFAIGVTVNSASAYVAVYGAKGQFQHSFAVDNLFSARGPLFIAVGPDGDIYAAPQVDDLIRVFSPAGAPLRTIGLVAHLAEVKGIAVDRAGNVYVTSRANPSGGVRNDSVVKLAPNGGLLGRFVPLPGATSSTTVLRGIAVAADGSLWVTTDGQSLRPPLLHLDARGQRIAAPDLRVLLPTHGTGNATDVDAANGLVYVSGTLGDNDRARLALAVLTPDGRIVDLVAGGAIGATALQGGDVVLAGFRSPPTTRRRPADLIDRGTARRFRHQTLVQPPIGSSAAVPFTRSGAGCGGGSSRNDLLVPFVSMPAGARCGVEFDNFASPCASGETTIPGRVFVGGEVTSEPVFARAGTGAYYSQVPAGEVRSGSVVFEYVCRRANDTRTIYEWKGEIALEDPSGIVIDKRTHAAIAGARVTLQFSPAAGARFTTPALGGISPQLTTEVTGTGGAFHWDVAAGRWRLVVRAFGYRPSTGKVFRVPPPVAGLRLALVPDPRQQAKLIRLAGRVGALRVGARIRPGTRVAGLKLRIVRRRLRGITVLRRTYRTAFGIGLRSTLKALRQAYPAQAAKVRVRTRGITTIRVQHVTFSVRHGVVTAIVVR